MFMAYGRTLDAARSHGIDLIEISARRSEGKTYFVGGEVIRNAEEWARSSANPFSAPNKGQLPDNLPYEAIARLSAEAKGEPWCDPANAAFDIPVAKMLKDAGFDAAQIALAYDTNPGQGVSADTTSLLNLIAANRFFAQQLAVGTEEYAVKGGNSRLPEAMARALDADIRLAQPVEQVSADEKAVTINYGGGKAIRAEHAVCTATFGAMRNISFDPGLPPLLAQAVREVPQNRITQVHMEVDAPFWQDDELSPMMWTDTAAGIVIPSHGADNPAEVTSLTAWARGNNATRLDKLSEADAGALVLDDIERIRPAAKGKLRVAGFKSWQTDPFTAGDWVAWAPGQATTLPLASRMPHGRLHFAGEHTSVVARGMEAAMESGERAALEILSA
jgi:monoamine oxidase